MAAGFFALFDDIAVLMDDVATMSKVATKKTAGVLGDDLAVNAEKASGFASSRELPVLWAITKGSLLNKLIILPFAFLLSAFAPWLIIPILMLGGVYLAYEGAEKIIEFFIPHQEGHKVETLEPSTPEEILAGEKGKIKAAILTDFILSIEIVIIALGAVTTQPFAVQAVVVSVVAVLATIGVYGIVAMLVRTDDFGYKLISIGGEKSLLGNIGIMLVRALPKMIKALSYIGTFAMLLVAGGIYVHNWHTLHEILHFMPSVTGELLVGLVIGIVAVAAVKLLQLIRK